MQFCSGSGLDVFLGFSGCCGEAAMQVTLAAVQLAKVDWAD